MLNRVFVMALMLGLGAWGATHWAFERNGLQTPVVAATGATSETSGMANSIQIAPSFNGHFFVTAAVNGRPIDFLVDSGASDIVLSRNDAERAGFNLQSLRYSEPVATANGRVMVAPVELRDLRIGQLRFDFVAAKVNPAPMNVSLLGMSFLNSLRGWEVRNGRLQLYW